MALAGISVVSLALASLPNQASAAMNDPLDDNSPWAMGTSAEWAREYPKFNPLLDQAGVKWMRLFPGWHSIEPKQGEFKWEGADKIIANAKENHIRTLGTWVFFPGWAAADGKNPRQGPVKDIKFWSDYVTATATRYQKDIKYWEVWNEFNGGGFYLGKNKPQEYADLMVAAYDAVKKINPNIKVGMSVANFDTSFLDKAIKAGAANHFDFICVHPYENLGGVGGDGDGENTYLSMTTSLRSMLAENKQRADIPLWISEMGFAAPVAPDPALDSRQADVLVKGFILSIAQGFQRLFWFEARGPAYGKGKDGKPQDLGIIRPDWSFRPAYFALKTMTSILGPEPKYAGWLDIDKGGYGFMFQTPSGPVLVAWASAKGAQKTKFDSPVRVIDLAGKETQLAAGQILKLTRSPVFITKVPATVVSMAQANISKRFPWGGDFSQTDTVLERFGTNVDQGIKGGKVSIVNDLVESWGSTVVDGKNAKMHMFTVHPSFLNPIPKELEITVVARRIEADKPSDVTIYFYESSSGYKPATPRTWSIPAGDKWQEHTWKVSDANFIGQWGYHVAVETPQGCLLKEIRIKKVGASAK